MKIFRKDSAATAPPDPNLRPHGTPCAVCESTHPRSWAAEWQDRPARPWRCFYCDSREDPLPAVYNSLAAAQTKLAAVVATLEFLGLDPVPVVEAVRAACRLEDEDTYGARTALLRALRGAGAVVLETSGNESPYLAVELSQVAAVAALLGVDPVLQNGFATVQLPWLRELDVEGAKVAVALAERSNASLWDRP